MSLQTQTVTDLVTGALRNLNVLAAAETATPGETEDGMQVLNDLLDAWSTEHLYVFSSTENILTLVPGKYQYTIGNPVGGTFTGTLVASSNLISGVTIPSNLKNGGTVTDVQNAVPAGSTIVLFGGSSVQLSANALSTVSTPETFTYTVPGDFAIARPLRITNAFTRITASGNTGLDYQIRIITRDKYAALGLKGINVPWPTDLYYDPTFPYGNLYFYGNPSLAGELHLWTDTLLANFLSVTQSVNLPQGYARAIKTNLAIELAAEYGKPISPTLAQRARESKAAVKALNAVPATEAFFDRELLRSRRNDAGWILHGGFYT